MQPLHSRSGGPLTAAFRISSGTHSEAHSRGHVLQKHGNNWVRGRDRRKEKRQRTTKDESAPACSRRIANLFTPSPSSACFDMIGFRGKASSTPRTPGKHTPECERGPTEIFASAAGDASAPSRRAVQRIGGCLYLTPPFPFPKVVRWQVREKKTHRLRRVWHFPKPTHQSCHTRPASPP